jgi:hypothetical protein
MHPCVLFIWHSLAEPFLTLHPACKKVASFSRCDRPHSRVPECFSAELIQNSSERILLTIHVSKICSYVCVTLSMIAASVTAEAQTYTLSVFYNRRCASDAAFSHGATSSLVPPSFVL